MKLSKHSKERMKQRTPFNHKERMKLFKDALHKGKSYGEVSNEKLKKYLMNKESWKSQVKLYKGYIFIHSKHSKQLYTMYELPSRFKGEGIDLKEKKNNE